MADEKEKQQPPAITALDGTTTLNDKMFFEPERLAYVSTEAIAVAIATAVEKLINQEPRPIVITAGDLLADLSNLAAAKALLANVVDQFETCKRLGAAMNPLDGLLKGSLEKGFAITDGVKLMLPGVAPATEALQGVITLISLFRENVTFEGVKTDLDQLTFRIVLAAELKEKTIDVRLYDTELPQHTAASSDLLTALQRAESARAEAWEAMAPHLAAMAEAQAKLDAAARVQNNAAAVEQAAKELTAKRQEVTPVTNLLERADAQLANLRTHLEKVDDKTGLMTLGKLLRAEMATRENAYVLHVGVVAAGGHHRVSHSFWRRRDDVGATGGAVARWALLERNGAFIGGGLQQKHRSEKFHQM